MLQGVHGRKISEAVSAAVGTQTIIAAQAAKWIYVHELMGDLATAGDVTVKAGSRVLATFNLDAGQGLTTQDESGEDGRPRFECKPGEAFVLTVTGGTFTGTVHYSFGE
jgi:hypothetical protein